MAFIVAERVVFVIDHLSVDVVVASHAQLTEVLSKKKRDGIYKFQPRITPYYSMIRIVIYRAAPTQYH